MTDNLKVRLHVTEPWDFERWAGSTELLGWTTDHHDPDAQEWEVHLDQGFDYDKRHIESLLAGPRYVGEHIRRMFDTPAGFPVRLAHQLDGEWQFAFGAMISQRHDRDEREAQDNGTVN